jgi:midasin
LPLSNGSDSSDLLGCFEQAEIGRRVATFSADLHELSTIVLRLLMLQAARRGASSGQSDDSLPAVHARLLQLTEQIVETQWLLRSQQKNATNSSASAAEAFGEGGKAATASAPGSGNLDGQSLALSEQLLKLTADACAEVGVAGGALQASEASGNAEKEVLSWLDAQVRLRKAQTSLRRLKLLGGRKLTGCFEWVDGALLQAVQEGGWVVLDNANHCSATVLDRMNALLEPGGVLMVNECGLDPATGAPRTVSPHPDFRMFLTCDPKYGEVSRAMRNRCVEVS